MTRPPNHHIEAAGKVLAKARLLDPRMSVDEGTILAWAEVLSPYQLTLDDLLPAVAAHYANSAERIMPADVIRLARAAHRDRLDRTALQGPERRALEQRSDAKALDDDTIARRRDALAKAAATIGNTHDVDTPKTFAAAPKPPRAESEATRQAKVARARAGWTPPPGWDGPAAPPAQCGTVDLAPDAQDCQLVAGHLGPHLPSEVDA